MPEATAATLGAANAAPLETLIALAQLPPEDCPGEALLLARVSLLDWLICGIAGASEPVAEKMRAFAAAEQGGRRPGLALRRRYGPGADGGAGQWHHLACARL
ncbi:hypothetical protein CLG85_000125 [Yangia mangrovi]|uniref:Uncharacterized protein n=1 Tax=Alloyangia mangrovi TaxID=1779329 RepID=A0ABT2KEP1_9RHOB|nr:MmgE/PrpD family protein [Alloyangia mangrovi]MCT4368835.1 hypothetical protein [Alloyangia mangrovi]